MSTELLNSLKQQAAALTSEEKFQLAQHLLEQAKQDALISLSLDREEAELKRRQRAEWLKIHRKEYAGRYVALDGDRLLGTGSTYPEAAAVARRAGIDNAYIDYIHPLDGTGFMGGW
ncbi:MAG: hypothetical protein L0229_06095 [Blastocatellia bacterium]|nr:hypothetical protein [Blastocatellia bacterium]